MKPTADERPAAFRIAPAYKLSLGFVAGALTGSLIGATAGALGPVADLFMGALEAAGPPVAAFALLSSLAAFSARRLTRFAVRSIAWFMGAALFAAAIGITSATALSVGAGYDLAVAPLANGAAAPSGSADWLEQFGAIVRGPAVHVAFWGLFALIMVRRSGALSRLEGARTALSKQCADVAFLILGWIMVFAPAGVFALAAITFSRLQLTAAVELLRVLVAVYAGQAVLCVASVAMLVAATRSRGAFFRGVGGALLTAFATGSSAATAPVEIASANERVGIDRDVAGLVIPLGLAISKIGTAVFIAVVLMFAAAAGQRDLTVSDLAWLALLACVASVITPPISGGALIVLGLFSSEAFLPMSAMVIAATVPLAGKLNTPLNSLGRLIAARVLSDQQLAQCTPARTLPD